MIAGVYNFIYQQGTSLTFLVDYQDNLNQPIDLTGYTARGQIRRSVRDESPTATFTIVIEDPTQGRLRVSLPPESFATAKLSGSTPADQTPFVYDIEIESGSGDVTRILQGTINVRPEVTR